jgi:hypothetical protein
MFARPAVQLSDRVWRRKMGIRKNAKFLTPAEKENFVKACVLMKAQIVNPATPAAQRYSRTSTPRFTG